MRTPEFDAQTISPRKMRVGIPRAMGYYYLYPFFSTLLRELGAEPVLSPATTKATLERMDVCPTDEPCLAVKLYFSHADALARRDDIDFLFMPIIAQVDKSWCCPKFIGIPDMTRNGLRLPHERVCLPVIDYAADDREMLLAIQPLATRLGTTDPRRLLRAISCARTAQQKFRHLCVTEQLTTPEAYQRLQQPCEPTVAAPPDNRPIIALIGHPYLIYEYVSLGMIDYLRQYGRIVTAEMVDPHDTAAQMATIDEGHRLWPFEAMLLGSALHLLRSKQAEKILLVGSFECGPESIIENYIEAEAEAQGIPLMMLALDEHSGEAGLMTRLEAFMDTDKTSGHETTAPPPLLPFTQEEMVLGFPSMGHLDLAIRAVVESCGVRTVHTPRTTQACIQLGKEIAPEFVCFPFIATLGQMRYMLERGANTLLMVGGKGYCRLGWYAQVQERLLRNIGHNFDLCIVESPFPLLKNGRNFAQLLQKITGGASWRRILSAFHFGYEKLAVMDRADQLAMHLRAFEREQGLTNRLMDRFFRQISQAADYRTLHKLEIDFQQACAAIEQEETNPIHVGIAGEIWVILEQIVTRDLERWLGARNRPRVRVHREHNASDWFRARVLHHPGAVRQEQRLIRAAQPWLSHWVGGHGQLTVGEMALAGEDGRDGMIHVFPFTCMPEIIAQNIIVSMAETLDMPVLTYIVSEQTGEAGMETRLESFLDLLEERRLGPACVPVKQLVHV